MCVGLFYILVVSVSLFSTSAFNPTNTKLRISFTSNYLSSHIAVSLSRMKALLLKRMLYKNRFLITFITSTLKKKITYSLLLVLESLFYFSLRMWYCIIKMCV